MAGTALLATMAYRNRGAARHLFHRRHGCLLDKVRRGNAHLASDARFYWGTGLLSGVLDNAPTYLTFLTAALSLDQLDINHLPDVAQFAAGRGSRLAAISLAATLFGGLTYIGNSPNLLIRAIAESRHVPAPGFLAYFIKYALPILIPVLALVGLIFFRG